MTHPLDEIAPAIARWLAPYIAEELRKTPEPRLDLSPNYDQATCREFLAGIGDVVLPRAEAFFEALVVEGDQGVESRQLAELLEVDSPRQIPSLLTNSLKRRAKALGLPTPWTETTSKDNRVIWLDRNDIARRMHEELVRYEHERRIPEAFDEKGNRYHHPLDLDEDQRPHDPDRIAELAAQEAINE